MTVLCGIHAPPGQSFDGVDAVSRGVPMDAQCGGGGSPVPVVLEERRESADQIGGTIGRVERTEYSVGVCVLGTLAGGRAAGIGIAVRPGALVVSLWQARSALPAGRVQGRHMHAEEIASSRLLLNTIGAQSLQAWAATTR